MFKIFFHGLISHWRVSWLNAYQTAICNFCRLLSTCFATFLSYSANLCLTILTVWKWNIEITCSVLWKVGSLSCKKYVLHSAFNAVIREGLDLVNCALHAFLHLHYIYIQIKGVRPYSIIQGEQLSSHFNRVLYSLGLSNTYT